MEIIMDELNEPRFPHIPHQDRHVSMQTHMNSWMGPFHSQLKPLYKKMARLSRKYDKAKGLIEKARIEKIAIALNKTIAKFLPNKGESINERYHKLNGYRGRVGQ